MITLAFSYCKWYRAFNILNLILVTIIFQINILYYMENKSLPIMAD